MTHVYKEVRHQETVSDSDRRVPAEREYNLAARIVSLIGGVIMGILAIRFVLSLLGANRANPFADFIYTLSHPFVVPFFGLFNYKEQIGVVRFEFETLVAIIFWGFVTWLIVRIITINQED